MIVHKTTQVEEPQKGSRREGGCLASLSPGDNWSPDMWSVSDMWSPTDDASVSTVTISYHNASWKLNECKWKFLLISFPPKWFFSRAPQGVYPTWRPLCPATKQQFTSRATQQSQESLRLKLCRTRTNQLRLQRKLVSI